MDEVTNTTASVGSILERLLDEAEGASSQAPPAPPPDGPPPPAETPLGVSPVASLLANPAVLSALPALMENLSPLLSGLKAGVGSAPTATRPHGVDRHTALLCALKPYLSPHRRETAETVIRLCRVWDALEKSGISLSGLLNTPGSGAQTVGEGRDSRV
jgi:hypothetical protein